MSFRSSRNNKGLTLVEILAIIVLLFIISSILFGIIINVKEQYNNQKDNYDKLTDTSYVFKIVTKDARKITGRLPTSTINNVSTYIFNFEDGTTIKYEHDKDAHILKRERVIISTNIKSFEVDNSKIKLTTENGKFATTIYFRNNIHEGN